jgi:membrane protein
VHRKHGMPDHPSPWNLGGLTLRELGSRVWNEIGEDEVTDRAAALAYYFLFALFPTLLFLTVLLGMLPLPGMMDRLLQYMDQALPSDAASIVRRTWAEIYRGARGGLLSIGVLTAIWASSNGMASIMSALNVAYDIDDTRPWWKRRLLAILLTFGFAMFILAALVLLVFGPLIGAGVAGLFGLGTLFTSVWSIVSLPIVVFFVLVGIALVYYLAPAAEQHWRWVTPGSVVALTLWLAMSWGLRLYVSRFSDYNATYGSIGGIMLLMLWLYLTGVVLLVGAEINAEIEHAAAKRGALTAKAPGEQRPPAEEEPEEGAWPLPGRTLDEDVAIAGRVVERWLVEARQRGWGAYALIGGGVLAGWMLRGRSLGELTRTGGRLAKISLQIAAAIAAVERFRHRTGAENATGEDATREEIEERRAA